MQFTIQIDVTAGKATLLQMPDLAEGSEGIVALAVTFDESWDAFPTRTAFLWREGEAVLRFPLEADNEPVIPSVFTQSDEPFLIRIMGENAKHCVQTNEICTHFRKLYSLDATDPEYPVYTGPYKLTENKKYSVKNRLLAKDLTVDVYTVDTSADTVTAETLCEGVTAHDASGNAITGTYTPPAKQQGASATLSVVTACICTGMTSPAQSTLTVKE